jgi:Ca-activated chloride channel family protein
MKRSKSRSNPKRVLVTVGVLFAMLMFFCITFTMVSAIFIRNITNNASTYVETYGESSAPAAITWEPDSAELSVAASPVMAPVLQALAGQFNSQDLTTPDGQPMSVQVVAYEPQRMVDAALDRPGFQAISPDSSLWLDQLDQAWAEQTSGQAGEESAIPVGQQRMGPQVRYAVSPIVIAAWESAARELGWPDQPVGWQDIQQLATQDPDFKWNHPSTTTDKYHFRIGVSGIELTIRPGNNRFITRFQVKDIRRHNARRHTIRRARRWCSNTHIQHNFFFYRIRRHGIST